MSSNQREWLRAVLFIRMLYPIALLALPIWIFELFGIGNSPWMWLPVLAIWITLLWLSHVADRRIRNRYQRYQARRRATQVTEWRAVS